jgi:predicted nucleic acid-binding protein
MPLARRSAAGAKAARFMLDTDTCSYIMKRSHPLVLKRLQALHVDDVCMSVITKAELLYGVEVSPRSSRSCRASRLRALRRDARLFGCRRWPLRGDPG